MNDHHYLSRVLKLSIVPRAFTFILTLVSFPLMVRAVGAPAYGVIIYIGAVISVLESGVDFGVSSAAGKAIAEARAHAPQVLRFQLAEWTRLQTIVALIGFIPLLFVSYLLVGRSRTIVVGTELLLVMVVTSWIAIAASFVRTCLRSCLEFRGLMIVDSSESVVRSSSWLIIAWLFPSAMGVAVASLVTVVVTSAIGTTILVRTVRRDYPIGILPIQSEGLKYPGHSLRRMMAESLSFLGLRLSTRMFQAFPVVLIGRLHGAGTVGILGAFTKIGELVNLPFSVIGNALAVRAQEILRRSETAVIALWNAVLRFVVLSFVLAGAVYFGADILARFLAPDYPAGSTVFAILSFTIVTSAISSLIAPISDYVGALMQRIILLTAVSFLQLPVIWLGSIVYGEVGAITAYVLALFCAGIGYAFIARTAYFGSGRYRPSGELGHLFLLIVVAFVIAIAGRMFVNQGYLRSVVHLDLGVLQAVTFVAAVAIGILTSRPLRSTLVGRSLFDFTGAKAGIELSPNQT